MTRLLQDILREPHELLTGLRHTLNDGRADLRRAAAILREAHHIYITGIGSSWHAGMAVQGLFDAAGFPAHLRDASELLHFTALPQGAALLILSRSGQSVEVVRLLDKAADSGARVIGVTNTPDSPLGQRADVTLRMNMAFDHLVSVAMYSGLTLVGGLLAAEVTGALSAELPAQLEQALAAVNTELPRWQRALERSDWLAHAAPAYFLARGSSLASCHETRLMWEEAAKAPAAAMMTGCFRHGPQEMIRAGTRVGMWLDGARMRENDLLLARDLREHGAQVMLIGQNLPADAAELALSVPPIPPAWQFLIDIIPAQLMAERFAFLRGEDCDAFRVCPYIITTEGGL
jgi:glucosamine--fructose-6-phosphate aminotransferase (isomerizing)